MSKNTPDGESLTHRQGPVESEKEFESTALNLGELFLHETHRFATRHRLDVVHLRALSFLQQANKYSDTSVALVDHLGLTKGTVSKSIALLAQRGLLRKVPDLVDRRRLHLQLTDAGQQTAQAFAEHLQWSRLTALLTAEQRAAVDGALKTILRTSQQLNERRTFGLCHTCRRFQREGDGGFCLLTQEALLPHQTHQRCREHEPPER